MPTLTIDYWRVEPPEAAASLRQLLASATNWNAEDQQRNLYHLGRVIRLREIERAGSAFRGEFVSVGLHEGGYRADVRGSWESIDFSEEEGLGRATAFVYSAGNRVLALQRNRTAASSSVVARFFAKFGESLDDLDLVPIPTRDALDRFGRLRRVTSVEVAVAGGTGALRDENLEVSAKDLLRIQERLGAPILKFEVSVGHQWRSDSILKDPSERLIRALRQGKLGKLNKLVVSGRTPNEQRDVIDLVTERITDRVELEPDEGRELSYDIRIKTIASMLTSRRPDLRLE